MMQHNINFRGIHAILLNIYMRVTRGLISASFQTLFICISKKLLQAENRQAGGWRGTPFPLSSHLRKWPSTGAYARQLLWRDFLNDLLQRKPPADGLPGKTGQNVFNRYLYDISEVMSNTNFVRQHNPKQQQLSTNTLYLCKQWPHVWQS